MLKLEDLELIHEAGFVPCYVRDLAEGDVIMADHHLRHGLPTEMTVGPITDSRMSDHHTPGGIPLRHWIGTLPSGLGLHCTFNAAIECWRKPSA